MGIVGLTRHQFYYKKRSGKPGRKPSTKCRLIVNGETTEVSNAEVVKDIVEVIQDPDTDYQIYVYKERITGKPGKLK